MSTTIFFMDQIIRLKYCTSILVNKIKIRVLGHFYHVMFETTRWSSNGLSQCSVYESCKSKKDVQTSFESIYRNIIIFFVPLVLSRHNDYVI